MRLGRRRLSRTQNSADFYESSSKIFDLYDLCESLLRIPVCIHLFLILFLIERVTEMSFKISAAPATGSTANDESSTTRAVCFISCNDLMLSLIDLAVVRFMSIQENQM